MDAATTRSCPLTRGHAPARPRARRRAARADRRGRLRARRGDPPDGDPLPPRRARRRRRRARRAGGAARIRCRSPTCCTSCARSAISRTSPTSPRTCTRTAAAARTRSPARRRSAAASRTRSSASRAAASTARRSSRWLRRRAASRPVLTAHPTEVQRKSILDAEREIARLLVVARPRRADARRDAPRSTRALRRRCSGCGRRRCCGCRKLAGAATRSTTGSRTTATRSSPRSRGCTPTLGGARSRATSRAIDAAAAVPAHGLVDRRRPRRQSVRHRRHARLRDPRAGGARVRALPRRGAPARRRAVAVVAAGARRPRALLALADARATTRTRTARTSRTARRSSASTRASPPRRATLARLRAAARRTRARAPYATPAEFRADLDAIARVARLARRGARSPRRGSTRCAARSTSFGFHLADARPAPEQRRARGGRRRAARAAPASTADYAALDEPARIALLARELAQPAAAALAVSSTIRRARPASSRSCARAADDPRALRRRRRCRST